MENEALDRASSGLNMLEVAVMMHEAGREDLLDEVCGCSFDYEEDYEFATNGLYAVSDLVKDYYNQNKEIGSYYFSSHDMMAYYRLCREYGSYKGIPLKDNPYMRRAKETVHGLLLKSDCYYCGYILQTKLNHQWASGIVFYYDSSYFYEYTALLSRMILIFQFYTETLAELRAELETLKNQSASKLIQFPDVASPQTKRRAA